MKKVEFGDLGSRSLSILERDVVTFFVSPADEDYLTARILWNYDRLQAFSWSASQAIEKYIKAALLLNGKSADFSHDFTKKGYVPLKELAGPLFAEVISAPINSSFDGLEVRSELQVHNTLERFERNGSPLSRYGQVGYESYSFDLHLFDSLCFMLRRVCVMLDAQSELLTWRKRLEQSLRLQIEYDFSSIRSRRVPAELNLEAHLLNGNFAFAQNPKTFSNVSRTAHRADGDAAYSLDYDPDVYMARRYLTENSKAKPEYLGKEKKKNL